MDSETNSDSSSAASPSPPLSPHPSFHAPPNSEQLVQYFVYAKRALTSTNYVQRANELVTSSRTLIEEIAILNARNTFTQRVVDEQIDTLYTLKDGIAAAGEEAGDVFQETISRLDLANDRLERTLDALKTTAVDASLRESGKNDAQSVADDDSVQSETQHDEKTLHDFIDETNHTDLQSSLRNLIDSFNSSREDLDSTIHNFHDSLTTISEILPNKNNLEPPDIGTIYDEPPPTIPQLFHNMEDHAAKMATLLQSLVSHYDLCVTALKHTEGGGEAAKKAIQQADEALPKNTINGVEESLYLKTVPEPISPEEKEEMLRVLENDAQEVEDVVSEIKDRNREQEGQYDQLSSHCANARSSDRKLRRILEMLHEMKDLHLPSHLHALSTFRASWLRLRGSIESQTAELASLSAFYDGFLSGYAKLLREAERRRAAEAGMRKVAEKARRELERLWEVDRGLRAEFMDDTGRFLPRGIWGGLRGVGARWEIREVGHEDGS